MWNKYDFPVFLLSEESTQTLRKVVFLLLCNALFLCVQSLVLLFVQYSPRRKLLVVLALLDTFLLLCN